MNQNMNQNINHNNKINRISLDPDIWGGKGWFFLDSIVLAYPENPSEEEKKQYKNFFYAIPTVGPCDKCRIHFGKFIKKYPLNDNILKSKDNLILWILSAHNNVKKINGQKQIKLKEFYEFYNKIYKTDVKINGCKDKCALTTIPDNLFNKEHMDFKQIPIKKISLETQYNANVETLSQQSNIKNFMTILFFALIIALSLYIYRITQLNLIKFG